MNQSNSQIRLQLLKLGFKLLLVAGMLVISYEVITVHSKYVINGKRIWDRNCYFKYMKFHERSLSGSLKMLHFETGWCCRETGLFGSEYSMATSEENKSVAIVKLRHINSYSVRWDFWGASWPAVCVF